MDASTAVFDRLSNTWILSTRHDIERAFDDPTLRVRPIDEPVPTLLLGSRAGTIFANLVRMTDGEAHVIRRAIVESAIGAMDLAAIDKHARLASSLLQNSSDDLDGWAMNVSPYTLGLMFGVEPSLLGELAINVSAFSRAISSGATATNIQAGIMAADELWDLFTKILLPDIPSGDLVTANLIGLFFQGCDSMAGLLGNALIHMAMNPEVSDVRTVIRKVMHETPSIRNTRRFAADEFRLGDILIEAGSTLLLDLEQASCSSPSDPPLAFGSGPHACPGRLIAFTIAAAALEDGPRINESPPDGFSYRPYPNARVPDLRGIAMSGKPI